MAMYSKEGSDGSLSNAASLAIKLGHYQFGFDLMIQKGEINSAFDSLMRIPFPDNFVVENQKWGEYLTRAVYTSAVEIIKSEIERKEGRKPKGSTIPELLAGRERIVANSSLVDTVFTHIDHEFWNSLRYAGKSSDPEIIQIGIELNHILYLNSKSNRFEQWYQDIGRNLKGELTDDEKSSLSFYRLGERYRETDIYLKGKLTGNEDCIQYLIKRAEETMGERDDWINTPAERAIEVLQLRGRDDEALAVAKKWLHPHRDIRLKLIEKLGRTQELALAYREQNDPINYALAVSGRNGEKTK